MNEKNTFDYNEELTLEDGQYNLKTVTISPIGQRY